MRGRHYDVRPDYRRLEGNWYSLCRLYCQAGPHQAARLKDDVEATIAERHHESKTNRTQDMIVTGASRGIGAGIAGPRR